MPNLKPSLERVIQQYANYMGIDPSTVTEKVLEETEERVEG